MWRNRTETKQWKQLHFQLLEVTLCSNKEYDEHHLIKNYSHITSQNTNSVLLLYKFPHLYFLEETKNLIVFNTYIISKMQSISETVVSFLHTIKVVLTAFSKRRDYK